MRVTQAQIFDAAVAMIAGAMANPAHAQLLHNYYDQQQALNGAMQAISQAVMYAGGTVAPDPVES